VADDELERRKSAGIPAVPESRTPWQEIFRASVGQLDRGATLESAVKYRGIAATPPRHNH
jgi:xylonate dehydratase